jgi:hypothetical protein
VVLKVYPLGGDYAKNYYKSGYVEGSDDKPSCFSSDGKRPDSDAQEPQAKSCAVCPHNQWGARINDNGKKVKDCQDHKRLAIASPSALNDPLLLRCPAGSLKALAQYGSLLAKRGVKYFGVLTRIGFDYTVAHPALTFKPVGLLDAKSYKIVEAARDSEIVADICGSNFVLPTVTVSDEPAQAEAPAQAEVAKPAAKPAAKAKESKAKAELESMVDTLAAAPKAEIAKETAAEQEPIVIDEADFDFSALETPTDD